MLLNELPSEIIVNISLRLERNQQLEFMSTCKRLKDVIYQRTFFDTLYLYGDKEKMESFLFKFRNNRALSKRVKILNLELNYLSDQLYSEVPLIFPNVEKFDNIVHSSDMKLRSEGVDTNFSKWKDTIKRMDSAILERNILLYDLLEKNVFSRLTYLKISTLKHGERTLNIVDCIKNAPSLTHLEMSRCTLTIEDIETIHSSAPLLVTFKARKVIISVAKEETLPEDITPASKMTNLLIIQVSIIDENCLYLEYITRKYTNLIKFELKPNFNESLLDLHFPGQTREEQRSNSTFNQVFKQACDTVNSYENSGSDVLSNLPATLKYLTIDSFNINNGMTIFTPKFTNIQCLEYFPDSGFQRDEFKQPENIDTLKNMTKLKTLWIVLEPTIHQYNHQGPLSTSITKLDVNIKGKSFRDDMDIGWLFSMFPSVNELNVQWSGARLIGYEGSQPIMCPNLTKLDLGLVVTHPKLLQFICNSAPNLKHLHWKIFGKKEVEKQPINVEIKIEEPAIKDDLQHYNLDLTGLSLDCFHLNIDLRDNADDEIENVYLSIKEKEDTFIPEFITSENYRIISPVYYELSSKPQSQAKARIEIKPHGTKMITINSRVSVDLENSKIIAGFTWG